MSKLIIPQQSHKSKNEENARSDLPIARVEFNLEKLPIWSTKPKRGTIFVPSKTIELEPLKTDDGQTVRRTIKIVPSAEYGYPTVETREHWYGVQHIWEHSIDKKTGDVDFSRRNFIINLLGKTYGKKTRKTFDLSMLQLGHTGLELKHVFYDKENKTTLRELRQFHLLTNLYLTERESANEVVHEKCSVTLHPLIVANLLRGYYKPVLLSVTSQLKSDIARLLYTKLDTQFSHLKKYEISTERFFREHGLEGNDYHKPSVRKRFLERGINELLHKPTSSGAVIEGYEFARTASNKDWKLLAYSNGRGIKNTSVIEINSAIKVPVSEVSEHTPETVKNPPEQQVPPSAAQKVIPTDIESLLEYFDTTFHGGKRSSRSQSILRKASSVIKEHGLPLGKYFVHYASGKCQETNYKPATFNGISKYLKEALEEHAREARINQRQKAQLQKLHEENKQADHLKTYEKAYYEYGHSLIELYSYKYPQELLAFAKAESAEEQTLKAAIEASPKSTCWAKKKQLELFLKKEQKVIRFYEFFKEDTTLRIPDFWEWDREINPHSLSKPSSNKVGNHP